jgi:hypothetical protein
MPDVRTRLKALYPAVPASIETDVGNATIGVVLSRHADKDYLCPLCDEYLEAGEQHLLVVPMEDTRLRRHTHAECVMAFLSHGVSIKLHPNEPHARDYSRIRGD